MTLGLTRQETTLLMRLNTPEKIQNFITAIPINHEPEGDTALSVREVLRQRRAHCIEGAFVAAAAFHLMGEPPWLLDMQGPGDADHVVTLYKRRGCWGAISKSNHIWLRGRDPIYRSLRELAMSYFHEYVNSKGERTLRTYSRAFDLRKVDPALWVTATENCWDLAWQLDASRHYPLMNAPQIKSLSRRDAFERKANKMVEFAE
jgi:hypothetical protein